MFLGKVWDFGWDYICETSKVLHPYNRINIIETQYKSTVNCSSHKLEWYKTYHFRRKMSKKQKIYEKSFDGNVIYD